MKKIDDILPTKEATEKFDMLHSLIYSMIREMKEFSKKKPDELLNKNKVKMINRTLNPIKELLKDQPTIDFLDLLDEELLPSNSDAVLIMGQFEASMNQYKNKFYGQDSNFNSRWFTQEKPQ